MQAVAIPFRKRLADDTAGSTLIEFAILAPVLFAFIFGVIQVGIHVQNANAVRNLAADGVRAAVVEYQAGRNPSTELIEADIQGRGVGPKYNLQLSRLQVDVTEETSRIAGVDEMTIAITYKMPNFLGFVGVSAFDIEYERPVFLLPRPAAPAA